MTHFLAEQMRSLIDTLDQSPVEVEEAVDALDTPQLKGSINAKQLADMLGIENLSLFTRSINKVRNGQTDKLSRPEMTEMAVAFVNLLAAEPDKTQKAMLAIKRVSAKQPVDASGESTP